MHALIRLMYVCIRYVTHAMLAMLNKIKSVTTQDFKTNRRSWDSCVYEIWILKHGIKYGFWYLKLGFSDKSEYAYS